MNAQPAKTGADTTHRTAANKEKNLRALMREMGQVLVAYSGGVDSAYLSLIATQELGSNAHCIIGHSPSVSAFQREEARLIAESFDFNFRVIETDELSDPAYAANPTNRCFYCKSELYSKLREAAAAIAVEQIADGTNFDDLKDHRPGRAAAEEKGVRSPLAEVGLTKSEIRERSRELGLPSWDKPASPCLSSRIAHGVPVTIGRLMRIEQGEAYLRSAGFREFRVRVHGDLARIEVAKDEMASIFDHELSGRLAEEFRKFGFRYVTLDLQGFRSGSLNEASGARTAPNTT